MRIRVNFTKNSEYVPNNQNVVNSYIHNKCLGSNEYHDAYSNYSISRLLGGVIVNGGKNVDFPKGGYILITSMDTIFMDRIVSGIINAGSIGYGMKLSNIEVINEKLYNGWNYFKTTDMGFMLKNKNGGYYTINDEGFEQVVKNHIINKFSKINPYLDFSDLEVIIPKHRSHKAVRRYVNNVFNISNVCQINIRTNKNLAEHIYNYGIGQSCGSGYGTIYTTQHIYDYK